MLVKNNFQCAICQEEYSSVEDLAIHQLDHLAITLPFLQICPFCDKQSTILSECLQHILNHLTPDRLEQAKLIEWLSPQYHTDNNSGSSMRHQEFDNFYVLLPAISCSLKCPYCDKFIYPENKLMDHAFKHFSVSSKKREHLRLWFNNFFNHEDSQQIVNTYCNMVSETKRLDLNSHLLEKLSLFESQKTNTCRYCKITLANASNLYQHYVEWHGDLQVKGWNCPICNFKEINSQNFIDHVYKKHMGCILCRKKFTSFHACWEHVKTCLRGCPACFTRITNFKELINHLNSKNGSSLTCYYCGERKAELDQLKGHMQECPLKPTVGVSCPFCKTSQFTQEEELQNHVKECRPWIPAIRSDGLVGCSNKIRRSNHVTESNFIKFSDIYGHLTESHSNKIKDCFMKML